MVAYSFMYQAPVKHCRSVETLLKALARGERARLTVDASPKGRPYIRRNKETATIRIAEEDVIITRQTYELIADRLDISFKSHRKEAVL